MTRQELIEHLAEQHSLSKAEAARVLATVTDAIMTSVKKEGQFTLTGFGTFKTVNRAARKGVNPRDGSPVKIAARVLPRFVAGSKFKDLVDPKAAKRRAAKSAK